MPDLSDVTERTILEAGEVPLFVCGVKRAPKPCGISGKGFRVRSISRSVGGLRSISD